MARMKTFFKYFLAIVLLYFFTNFATVAILKSTYKTKEFSIDSNLVNVQIYEAKATLSNGYVRGKITNAIAGPLKNKILKLDFVSPRGIVMGTKYVQLKDMAQGESQEFESKFNYDNVDKIKADIIDTSEMSENQKKKLDFSLDNIKFDKLNYPWYVWFFGAIVAFGL